ncbi:MAG: hypothetical protein EON55_06570 [Alphaproteobacteria bacterium]|nr:MAG: hypothetical protein EON55_06570 [Alphaproteobacteria bacterium]
MYLPTPDDFAPWVGRSVRLATVPAPVEITLLRIDRSQRLLNAFREPFVLIFESPEDVLLLDETYAMDCGRNGPHAIYISQLHPRPGQPRRYQAVFS